MSTEQIKDRKGEDKFIERGGVLVVFSSPTSLS